MSALKGLTIPAVLAEIRSHRKLVAFWTEREFPGIAADHAASVRDLQIVLTMMRFPETPLTYSAEFTPTIIITPDTISDADTSAFIDAMMDNANAADEAAELVSA